MKLIICLKHKIEFESINCYFSYIIKSLKSINYLNIIATDRDKWMRGGRLVDIFDGQQWLKDFRTRKQKLLLQVDFCH